MLFYCLLQVRISPNTSIPFNTTTIVFSCVFLWNTVGAKHNPNSHLQKQCLPEEVQNVHKHVLCFAKDTCQNPADASSIGKYLAQAMSPKISLLVGSGKYSFLNILTSFLFGFSLCKWMLLLFPAVVSSHSISTATHGFSDLSEHLPSLILAPASRWVVWTVVMLHSLCSVLIFWGFLFSSEDFP